MLRVRGGNLLIYCSILRCGDPLVPLVGVHGALAAVTLSRDRILSRRHDLGFADVRSVSDAGGAACAATTGATSGARVRQPEREPLILCPGNLDDLLAREHPARRVVAFVERTDLSALYASIRAREGAPGDPLPDPRLLVALWLYATIDG